MLEALLSFSILVVGFGAILLRRWVVARQTFGDRGAAVQHAIATADGQRSVLNAEKMLGAIRKSGLGPEGEARLQPELARLERAVERSSTSWTALKLDPVTERSEFASALSSFIAKLRVSTVGSQDSSGETGSRK